MSIARVAPILALAVFVTLGGTAGAKTIIVGPGESIQAAIDLAVAGDIVSVKPGTYAQQIAIKSRKNIQVIGIISATKQRPILDGATLTAGNMVEILNSKGIAFKNFTVRNAPLDPAGPTPYNNILIDESSSVRITGNLILNAANDGVHFDKGTGIAITGNQIKDNDDDGIDFGDFSAYNSITGNTISNNAGDGIDHHYGNFDLIVRNTISGNGGYGLYSDSYPIGMKITDNTVTKNGSYGIHDDGYGAGPASNVIKGNKVINNGSDGIYVYMTAQVISNVVTGNAGYGIEGDYYTTILNNVVRDNTSYGIYTYYGGLLSGNTVVSNDDIGIYVGSGYGANVLKNTVRGNGAEGIYVDDDVATLANNTSTANLGTGLMPYYDSVITKFNTSANNDGLGIDIDDYGNTVQQNVVTGNSSDGIGDWVGYSYVISNTVRNNDGDGITDLTNSVVKLNVVTGNKVNGIDASYAGGNYIRGNTCSLNVNYDLFDTVPPGSWWIANTGKKNW